MAIGKISFNLASNNPDKDDIPSVQVLVPGFSVKELPLTLPNVVRYSPDGRLYALAYDGHIYTLTDTERGRHRR